MYLQTFLQANKPADSLLLSQYELDSLRLVTRQTSPGWTDPLGLPTTAWYDTVATISPANRLICVNHEAWPINNKPNRLEFARKAAVVITELKARRPDWIIGFYSFAPLRDFWRAIEPITSAQFKEWQAANDDMIELAHAVDVFFPSIYYFYTMSANGPTANQKVKLYCQQNIAETKRLRALGNVSRPIYPFTWWMKHDGTMPLDLDAWRDIIRTSKKDANGFVLWGGWLAQWVEKDPWWTFAKAAMLQRCFILIEGGHVDESGQLQIGYSVTLNEPPLLWGGSLAVDPADNLNSIKAGISASVVRDALSFNATLNPSTIIFVGV